MSEFSVERKPATRGKSKKAGVLTEDKYKGLITKPGEPPARVNMLLSYSTDFGAIKVSASVTLSCDQDEATINKAGGLAYEKAYELLMDGWNEFNSELQTASEKG